VATAYGIINATAWRSPKIVQRALTNGWGVVVRARSPPMVPNLSDFIFGS
jgi:hypothetical protein